jgi:hypothetical protein
LLRKQGELGCRERLLADVFYICRQFAVVHGLPLILLFGFLVGGIFHNATIGHAVLAFLQHAAFFHFTYAVRSKRRDFLAAFSDHFQLFHDALLNDLRHRPTGHCALGSRAIATSFYAAGFNANGLINGIDFVRRWNNWHHNNLWTCVTFFHRPVS